MRLVCEQDVLADGGNTGADPLHEGSKVLVENEDLVFCMSHRVHEVFGGQARIDRMEDSADAGDAKVHLQVAVAVPLDHTDPVAWLDPQSLQGPAQAQHALVHGAIGVAYLISIDDLLIGRPRYTLGEKVLEQQLIIERWHFCLLEGWLLNGG